jgi:subtilisin
MRATAAAGLVGTGLVGSGTAVAQENDGGIDVPNGELLVNVGYENTEGKREALDVAEEVVREFREIPAITIEAKSAELDELLESDDVRYVEVSDRVQTTQQTVPWGIERVGARTVHERGELGTNGSIAVIDTGIDSTHEDLAANLGEGIAIVECVGECDQPWDDDRGHGTRVAGVAGALDNDVGVVGVAPDVRLHAVKVLNEFGVGWDFDVAAGIEWTARHGIDVGNLSLGTPSLRRIVGDAVEYAYGEGVLLVGSAGNRGPGEDNVSWPAAFEEVVAVGATSEDDSLAWFSSTGSQVELAAPGEGVLSTFPDNEYGVRSGTSLAAPHVSGAGALLMSNALSNTETRETLRETAEDIGLDEIEGGFGLLDVAAALPP